MFYGTYILSAKRWGTWLLYNLFKITEFTPFWLDAVVSMFIIIIAIVLCAFIRKQYKNKISTIGYIVFSGILISNPLINQFFIYQSTNLAIVISNLMMIISAILIFENYFSEKKKCVNAVSALLILIAVSMYESCIQTYLVMIFVTIFIKVSNENIKFKEIAKYFSISILIPIISIILYFIIGKILLNGLEKFNLMQNDFALKESLWQDEEFMRLSFNEKIIRFLGYRENLAVLNNDYISVKVFYIFSIITIILEWINLIKTGKALKFISVIGAILSNFILLVLLLTLLFRMQFSWIITTAFLVLYLYQKLSKNKYSKCAITAILIMLIILQTKSLNQYFYNDYKRYEKEKVIANDIGINIAKNCAWREKPLLFVGLISNPYMLNFDNSISVINWGTNAFKEKNVETTKFINAQGYSFKYLKSDIADKYYSDIFGGGDEELIEQIKSNAITELRDIIINLNFYNYS